jgi:hypothetical protein
VFRAGSGPADLEVHAFERAEGALHLGQALIVQDGGSGAHIRFGNGGADHMEGVERGLSRDALFDRLTHHCEIVETANESWRFKHRA